MKRILKLVMICLVVSGHFGCHYVPDHEDHGTGPSLIADFAPGAAGGLPSITLEKGSTDGTTIYLNVIVAGASNLYAANFKISYDAAKVKWGGGYQAGAVLESNGTVNYMAALDGGAEGIVVAGASLQGGAAPVASADGVIISIPFTVLSRGSSAIDFTVADLYDGGLANITLSATAGGTVSGV